MKRLQLFLLALRVPVDYAALILAGYIAYVLRFESSYTSVRPVLTRLEFWAYWSTVLTVGAIMIPIFALAGLYVSRRIHIRTELLRVVLGCSAGIVALIMMMFWQQEMFSSRFVVLVAWGLAILTVGAGRLLVRLLESVLAVYGFGVKNVVVIGTGHAAEELTRGFARSPSLGLRIIHQYKTFDRATCTEILKLENADELLLADLDAPKRTVLDAMNFAEENHFSFVYAADLLETATKNVDIATYAGIPVISIKPTRLEGWGRIFKRAFDLVGASILIVLASPIMLAVAILIKLDSPGPILYSQKRVGERGREFNYFKFRSMRVGAHAERAELEHLNERAGSPMFKMKNDPRVTRVGKYIRKASIDELPEFFLVFMGRMSLVGPRPHLPEEVARYEPHQRKVHNIKPGITGIAQISGRADLAFDEEVRLDMFYMENWSPWLDIYILFKTPLAVFSKKGAV
ncbi:MAG: sugar transferase [bacterium]